MTTGSELIRTAGAQVAEVTAGRRRFADLPDEIKDLTRKVLVPSKEITDAEVEWCLAAAEARGLSPLNGQIHFMPTRVKDKDSGQWRPSLTPVVGITGWVRLAERTGKFEGFGPVEFLRVETRDGEHVEVWSETWFARGEGDAPVAARCAVYRTGWREPIRVPVRFAEFARRKDDGSLNKTWAEKPSYMLAKCARVASLRVAFPEELAGFIDEDDPAYAEVGEVIDAVDAEVLSEREEVGHVGAPSSEASASEGERGGGGSGDPGAAAAADPLADAADQALEARRRREPDDDPPLPPLPPLPGQEQLV